MILRRKNLAFVWAMIAVALFMRAAVPAGWMPDQTHGDSIVVRICNAATTIEIPLKRDGRAPVDGKHHAPCAFAGFAGAAPLPAAIDVALADVAEQTVPAATLAQFQLGVARRFRPPGRAPPVKG
ncbi:hypothetical protein [Altererythrobacter sp.]|uniref:hypothetical protein n=1 Tax=Altererythrobacter sp. TaxID=1872480 RepID=UPI003D083D22